MQRKIIHIDMDAFYASVEQRDNASLRGKPVAIGGDHERSVVSAASYEARKFGVRSAMPMVTAKRRCKDLIIIKPRISYYKEVSNEIMNVFSNYTSLIEPLSLDEAFLDVTDNFKNNPSATLLAKDIKADIKRETGLVASAGVSYNKFLAKLASDVDKPDGLYVITPEMALDFIAALPIKNFFGVGRATALRMSDLGITTGADLRQKELLWLLKHFGKSGQYFYSIVRGVDNRPVIPYRKRKSLGAERTFKEDLTDHQEIVNTFLQIAGEAYRRMKRANVFGRTLTIKVKYEDFTISSRSKSFQSYIKSQTELERKAQSLLQAFDFNKGVRLMGVSVSNLNNIETDAIQLSFDFPEEF